MRLKLYRTHGEWRWRLLAANGRKIATGNEGYKRKIDCLKILRKIFLHELVDGDYLVYQLADR
jgi:uncharacterized protein YegP (UPF0339 family)